AAVADAWTTRRDAALSPTWARLAPRRDHPHVFGDRMAAGVLLTLAAASMIGGGIDALVVAGSGIDSTIRAAICGAVALVLLGGAVALRLLRGSDDLRGALAVTGIAYAATCLAFAYNPQPLDDHDLLLKFTLAAGLVALLGWVAAVLVPSAVAGTIAVVALATAAGASVWLAQDQPTHSQVFVAAIGVGLAVALVLPAVGLLRPHPTGLGWALGGAALVITIPALVLMSRDDGFAIAAGATASAALLALAQEHRNLPAALGAFAGLGYLEVLLIGTRAVSDPNQQLVILVAVGVALLLVVSAVAVLAGRARPAALPRRRLPLGVTQLLLVAALVLSIVALFAGNTRDVRLTPNQLQPRPSQGSVALR
ncbi:MAG TPA: hypothetical protein VFC09_10055, partial [Candidatus Dormibacteraeota bacterium]|nr:hypothetical protein [Candidatus Dormibacteraeota bacterium]